MKKIITLSLVLAVAASAAFAGGGKEDYVDNKTPAVPSSLPNASPLLLLLLGGGAVAIIGGVLGNSGNDTPPA